MASRALTSLLAFGLLAGTGCQGNWSNEDLLFRAAVPRRDELRSDLKAPAQPAASDPSVLAVLGERSQGYEWTIRASSDFNGMLYGVLAIFEEVLKHDPTRREPDRRIWGPFRVEPGKPLEAKVTIARRPLAAVQEFTYALELRKDASSRFVRLIEGSYDAAVGGIRTGKGQLTLDAKALAAEGIDSGDLRWVDSIAMSYDTAQDPLVVGITLKLAPGQAMPVQSATYLYEKYDAGNGRMRFELEANVVGGPGTQKERIAASSRWLASGAGRTDWDILSGDGVGARQVECWNDALNVVHLARSWDGTSIGNPAHCPPVPAP